MPKKPHVERVRAAERLTADGPLFPLSDLRGLCGYSERALVRFGVYGKTSVYLDVVLGPDKVWRSSQQAIQRFLSALEVEEQKRTGGAGPANARA